MPAAEIDWAKVYSLVEPVLNVIHDQVRLGIVISAFFLCALFIGIFGIMKKHDRLHYRAIFFTVLPLICLAGILFFNIIPSLRPPLMVEGMVIQNGSENPYTLSSRVQIEVEKAYSFSAEGLGRKESRFEGFQNFPVYKGILDEIETDTVMTLLVTVDLEVFGCIKNGEVLAVSP